MLTITNKNFHLFLYLFAVCGQTYSIILYRTVKSLSNIIVSILSPFNYNTRSQCQSSIDFTCLIEAHICIKFNFSQIARIACIAHIVSYVTRNGHLSFNIKDFLLLCQWQLSVGTPLCLLGSVYKVI